MPVTPSALRRAPGGQTPGVVFAKGFPPDASAPARPVLSVDTAVLRHTTNVAIGIASLIGTPGSRRPSFVRTDGHACSAALVDSGGAML